MKRYHEVKYSKTILIAFLLISLVNCGVNKLSIKEIKGEQLDKFIGEEVKYFLNKIEEKYIKYYFYHDPPSVLRGCVFIYESGIHLMLFTNELKYLKKVNPDFGLNWSIKDFFKEKISAIKIK